MRLKKVRKKENLTQKTIADFLGVTQNTYSQYENGVRNIDIPTLKKLAEYFNVTVDYLIGFDHVKCETEDDDTLSNNIYKKLVEIGFIEDGDEITDKHLEVITKILAPQIDYAKFQLAMEDEKNNNK